MAKKAIKPNIVRGGIGIPIPGKTNYYYMKGRKHKDGGIDIGSNPRTGLEVEDGEVIHLTDNNIKVFSSVPFLNGQSPAEKVMGGENPNKVFKQQEDFKDRNKLNDDGTRKAGFGKWLKNTLIKGAQLASEASRDVRTGGASSHVKELVDKGKHEEAKQFAENYFKANTLGISLGAGTASSKLATDLLITTGTSAADAGANFITKDANSAAKQSTIDTAINIAGDVLGKGIGKVLDIGPVKQYIGKKLGYVEDMNGYIKEGSHFRIVDKPAIDDAIQSGSIRAKTGLYHGTPEYLRENFSKYLPQLGDWETMDAFEIRKRLKELGAIGENNLLQTMYIRNSTNHGGTVGYFRNTPYPNYLISKDNYVIETPESLGVFVPGHHGKEHINIPLDKAGATVLKTNGSIKNASIPTKGSSYWKYSPFWGMWKNTKFNLGGEINDSVEYPKHIRKNKKAMGGDNKIDPRHAKLIARRGMPGDIEALRAAGYDKYGNSLITFNGGNFGGSGAGMEFNSGLINKENSDYIRNTPILRSFSDAFAEAKRNNKSTFIFNGKEFTTEVSDNPNYIGKRYEPALNIREVLDENKKVISDSTRVEPYIGQIPGTHKRIKKAMGGTTNKPVTVTVNGKTKVIYSPSTGGTRSEAEGNRIKGKLGLITKIGNFIENNKNLVNDGLSLAGNITGSLLSNRANRKMLNSLEYGPAPISLQPTKLKTRININPQLDKMRETLERYNSNVDANTASSRVALARKNRAVGEILGQYNSLLGDKENKETQLINQDRLNKQSIANQNIANYNTYLTNKSNFENKVRELKGENKVNLINNLNSAIQNTITTGEKRRRDRNSLIAVIAANPNVNPQMLKDLGFDGLTQKEIDLINKHRKVNK